MLLVHDLGTLAAGASSDTRWLSADGLISGDSQNGAFDPPIPGFPEIRGVLWPDGKSIDLGTLHGGHESIAHAVNSFGQVVGLSLTTVPDDDSMANGLYGGTFPFQTRAFLWQNGKMHDLRTLGTGTNAIALFITEIGQVAGDSYRSSEPSPSCASFSEAGFSLATGAFLWSGGKLIDLGSLGGTCTVVRDLNNFGQVVGISNLAGDTAFHPFLWNRGTLQDLGTLGGDTGMATVINDAGAVAGWADLPGNTVNHAVLWDHGRKIDLGGLPGFPCTRPFSINLWQQVVGVAHDCFFGQGSAFLSEPGHSITDLNDFLPVDSYLHLRNAVHINNSGQIAITAEDPDGNRRAHEF